MVVGWAGYDGRRSLDGSSHDVCFGGRYVVSVCGVVVVVVVNWVVCERRENTSSLRCGLGGLSIGRQFGKAGRHTDRRFVTHLLLPLTGGASEGNSLVSADRTGVFVARADGTCSSIGCNRSAWE